MGVARHMKAAAPAARRWAFFFPAVVVLIIIAAAWATDGFTVVPKWGNKWVDDGLLNVYYSETPMEKGASP